MRMTNNLIFLFMLMASPFALGQKTINEADMKKSFVDYYTQLMEEETHYNETAFESKINFAKEQAGKKKKLFDGVQDIYSQLVFGDREGNRLKLSKIRLLRENFNKDQKIFRERFKKNIFAKKKRFEDLRLKKKSEFEIKLRKWRAQAQDKSISEEN